MSQPAINATAEQYAARLAGFLAPEIGLGEYADKMPDHSQEAADAMDSVNAGALAQLDDLETESANDETTKDAPIERLIVERQLHTVGVVDLNNIASPVQDIRSTFDLMPTATSEDRENIATSLTLVGTSLPTYQQRLAPATAAGHPSTTRLADTCIVQLHVTSQWVLHRARQSNNYRSGLAPERTLAQCDSGFCCGFIAPGPWGGDV